jgi:DNA-binding XRE family transcriptional regulator
MYSPRRETYQTILKRNIKMYRKRCHLTQSQLAELIDVHSSYVCKLETCNTNPTFKTLTKISMALRQPLYKLFKMEESW